jgi:hypothetical protein
MDRDMAGCSAAGRAPNQPESIFYVPKKLDHSLSFAFFPYRRVGRGVVGARAVVALQKKLCDGGVVRRWRGVPARRWNWPRCYL